MKPMKEKYFTKIMFLFILSSSYSYPSENNSFSEQFFSLLNSVKTYITEGIDTINIKIFCTELKRSNPQYNLNDFEEHVYLDEYLHDKQILFPISSIHITSLPTEIGLCSALEKLFISNQSLTSLPTEIGFCSSLRNLDLSSNMFTSISTQIGFCSQLKGLYLWGNQLTSIPTEIGFCSQLEELSLGFNQLTSIPTELAFCTNLKVLDIAQNPFSSFPTQIISYTTIERLNLSENFFRSIPLEIQHLQKLKLLDLSDNNFLPISISGIKWSQRFEDDKMKIFHKLFKGETCRRSCILLMEIALNYYSPETI